MAETQLMRAVKKDPVTAFKLIKKKKDINATNVKGQTALMMAVENNPQLVAPLIEYGANVNVFDKDGNTPLMLAKKYALDVVDILTVAGAKNVKPVMQPGMKLPTRTEVEASKANREFKIELQNGGVKNTYKKRIVDKIGDFVEQLLRDGVVSDDDKIEVKRKKTAEFMLDKEVLGFRIDLDAKFGEYPDFFRAGETTDITVSAGSGLLKLKNLMHENWKEARKFALNTEDEEEVMNEDPFLRMELDVDDEDELVYYRDKSKVLRLLNFDSFKNWLNYNKDKTSVRDIFSGFSYNQNEIRGLSQLVNGRPDFNTIISTQNIGQNNVRDDEELISAVRDSPEQVQALIDAGADVNAVDEYELTVLMSAIKYQPSVVQTLIDADVDVNAVNLFGQTALMVAAGDQPSVVQTLIDAGADVNAASRNGFTALMAAAGDQPSVVQTLIDAGADVNAAGQNGRTALLNAVDYQPSVVQTLIDADADINYANRLGLTALMQAARYQPSLVQTLINAGTDINARDNSGLTALNYAIDHNKSEAVRILRAADARE